MTFNTFSVVEYHKIERWTADLHIDLGGCKCKGIRQFGVDLNHMADPQIYVLLSLTLTFFAISINFSGNNSGIFTVIICIIV